MIDILKPYVDTIKDFPEFRQANEVKWDPLWYLNQKSGGSGRLIVSFPKSTFPSVIVEAMLKLIELTFDDINDNLPINNNSSDDSNNSKDKTKYKFNDVIYGKNRLVLEVVKQYIKDNPDISYQQLEDTFLRMKFLFTLLVQLISIY